MSSSHKILATSLTVALLAWGASVPAVAEVSATHPGVTPTVATVATETLPTPTVRFRTLDDGRLQVNMGPNLPDDGRWRYRLDVREGGSWVPVTADSYRDRGYFYTRGSGEIFRHRVLSGVYRVRVSPGQHGHTRVTTEPFEHVLPVPTVAMRTLFDGRLLVNLGPNLPDGRWRYRLEAREGSNWIPVTDGSYRGRGYFYTTGRTEVFRHRVEAGAYRVRVMAGQHGHDGLLTGPFRHDPPNPQSVSAGSEHVCILDTMGRAWCVGENSDGQLGNGETSDRYQPVQVAGDHTFTALAVTADVSCGLDDSGAAWCWGENYFGQLGDGTKADRSVPVAVSGGHTFTTLDTGGWHTCGIDDSGAAWCWGLNIDGGLGNGSYGDQTEPVAVVGSHIFSAIEPGTAHTCALDEAGAAWCWGDNWFGELGTGTDIDNSPAPLAVADGHAFAALSAAGSSACAIDGSADTWCWGSNSSGGLGDGSTTHRNTPVQVSGEHTFATVAVGNGHTCAIDEDDKAWCWGSNGDYQLGDGTNTDRSEPVLVAEGELAFRAIDAGTHLSAGILHDRTVVIWGAVDDWSGTLDSGRILKGGRMLR